VGEPELKRLTPDEFLVWQTSQDRKYELVDGLPTLPLKSMTGATHAHDRVTINLLASLHQQLRGKPCKPATDAIALRIPAGNVRRPDVMVECGQVDLRGTSAVEPKMAIEILSPSTMNFDRTRKVDEYKTVQTLAYILLVDTESPRLTLHVRRANGWDAVPYDALDAVVDLPAIGCRLAARDIFEGLPFAG
jgi:Uma2 family endonuclease